MIDAEAHELLISQSTQRMVGCIPVRNLWLLMWYASDLFRMVGNSAVRSETDIDDLPDLVAEILARAVELRQQRQLTVGYRDRTAVLNRVRGRIEMLSTERHQLLSRGQVACTFNELTADTPRNRFVRGALASVAQIVKDRSLAHRCRALANAFTMQGVSTDVPSRMKISTERFGRHDSADKFMVAAARLAFDLAMPTEDDGTLDLVTPDREEHFVRQLFERAVGGFYDVVLSPLGWRITTGRWLDWQITSQTEGINTVLPTMKTDIIVEKPDKDFRLVIDTKFTSIFKKGHYRQETLSSGYLYQLYTYIMSQTGTEDYLWNHACGMLLHPSIGVDVDETVVIQEHPLRFATVDLVGTPSQIRQKLLSFVNIDHWLDRYS